MQEHVLHERHPGLQHVGGTGFEERILAFHLSCAVRRSVEDRIAVSLVDDCLRG